MKLKLRYITPIIFSLAFSGCTACYVDRGGVTAATTTTTEPPVTTTVTDEYGEKTTYLNSFGDTIDTTKGDYNRKNKHCSYYDSAYFLVNGEVKSYKIGDKLGDFTLKNAFVAYDMHDEPVFITTASAELEGEFTIKGFISMSPAVNGFIPMYSADEESMEGYEITFKPDGEKWLETVPDIRRIPFDEAFPSGDSYTVANDSNIPTLYLGVADDYEDVNLSAIPNDGSEAYVEITLKNLYLRKSEVNTASPSRAEIVSVELSYE